MDVQENEHEGFQGQEISLLDLPPAIIVSHVLPHLRPWSRRALSASCRQLRSCVDAHMHHMDIVLDTEEVLRAGSEDQQAATAGARMGAAQPASSEDVQAGAATAHSCAVGAGGSAGAAGQGAGMGAVLGLASGPPSAAGTGEGLETAPPLCCAGCVLLPPALPLSTSRSPHTPLKQQGQQQQPRLLSSPPP